MNIKESLKKKKKKERHKSSLELLTVAMLMPP